MPLSAPTEGDAVTPEPLVLPFRHGPFRNLSYLVACLETGEAAVIDPAWDTAAILEAATSRGLRITHVLLSHGHDDHTHGVAHLVETTGATVFVHQAELADLRRSFAGPVSQAAGESDVSLGRLSLRILHTPGHSPGSLSYLCGSHLFTGDTLMVGAMGRPAPGHEAVTGLWHSVANVLHSLPPGSIVHPGHDAGPSQVSTLAEQFARIPALRAESLEAFIDAMERETGRIIGRPWAKI